MRKLLSVLSAVVVVWSFSPKPTVAQVDPLALFQQHVDAHNSGNVAAQMALLDSDAVYVGAGGPCGRPPGCGGIPAIRGEAERHAANHRTITVLSAQASGNTVSARIELLSDPARARGVARLIAQLTMEIKGDKIAAIREVFDLTDPETAAFVQGPAAAGQLPRTGEQSLVQYFALLLGAGLLAAGWRVKKGWRVGAAPR